MHTKNIVLLAVAGLAADVVAVNVHRHGHDHLHEKKAVKVATEFETVTEWVTVTYDPAAPATTASLAGAAHYVAASHSKSHTRTRKYSKPSSSSAAVAAPSSSPPELVAPAPSAPTVVVTPTTLATLAKPTEVANTPTSVDSPAPAPPASTTAAPPPPATTSVAAPATSAPPTSVAPQPTASAAPAAGRKGRGLAYNDPDLLSAFVGGNSHAGWTYSWGQVKDNNLPLEFVPMLWSPRDDHASTWQANANKAIAQGSTCLLSFNEPDNAGQANLDPATAAAEHIKHMNPFAGKARIGSPAFTNSNIAGEGIDALKAWISACGGQCQFDFCVTHWYSPKTDDFFNHIDKVHDACGGKPVWVTEFAPVGNQVDPNDFLTEVVHKLDTDPKYSYVEAYAYFMVSEDRLVTGGKPNKLGNTFAFAS